MEKNPYEYDTTLSWIPQQNQYYETGSVIPQVEQQHLIRPLNQEILHHNSGQKPRAPQKMSKARALALANMLKRWFAVASIIGFGTFGGLVALHQVHTTASQSTSGSSKSNTPSSSSSQNNNGFLNQQGGNTGGTSSSSTSSSSTSNSSQGSSSGSNTASPTPVTGTSTS